VKRRDFQELSALRLKEAKLLLQGGCPEGAYYLAGYSAECALKACIAKQTARHDFPDKVRVNASYTHNLEPLIKLANLVKPLKAAETTHPELNVNWKIVTQWGEANRRYDRASRSDAEALINALGDRKHGVLRWLRQYW
jgi:hypothetical protein